MRSAVFVCLSLSVFAGSAAAQSYVDYSGRQLFQHFCSSCHGDGGSGDGPVAASFRTLIPDLTELKRRSGGKFPEDRVRRIIDGRQAFSAHGSREMPVWGQEFWVEQGADATAQEQTGKMVDRLVEYLHSIQR